MRSALAALAAMVIVAPSPASAGDDPVIDGGVDTTGLFASGTVDGDPPVSASGGTGASEPSMQLPDDPQPGLPACQTVDVIDSDFIPVALCPPEDEAEESPDEVTPADARRAFERLELPGSTPTIEPPDGLTLVNFDTNFYTSDTQPLSRTVTLLGHQVTIEATPATWTWTFGDGHHLTTEDPGAPYPNLRTTHDYTRVGTYDVTLATTYTGRFRVTQGPWQTIPGTVTITSAAQQLRTIEATPQLVGH